MASLTIRRLDDDVKRRLRIRAAEHGRSMEEEARLILTERLVEEDANPDEPWWERLHRMAAPWGGLPDPPPRTLEPYRDPFAEE